MTILNDLRAMPPVGSGRAREIPGRHDELVGQTVYVVDNFVGTVYFVVPVEEEESPEARFVALVDAARAFEREGPDYPDSPEQAQERTDMTTALYLPQARAIEARDIREQ